MSNQVDLFGDSPRVRIENNSLLETLANHILDLTNRDKSLLDGDTVGSIDRRLVLAVWMDEGLGNFIPEDKRAVFAQWFSDPQKCPDLEAVSRARRFLQERDLIRLSQRAIVTAEQHRQRIARSVKG